MLYSAIVKDKESKRRIVIREQEYPISNCGLKFAEVDCLLLQEVELDEDGNIIECEYINICYPDAKKYDIIKARVQNDLDDLAQDYLNEKYNQEALYEYRK